MKPTPVYKYKPRTNNLRHLLDDEVLDDETRKMLMKDIIDGGRRPNGNVAPPATQPASTSTGTNTGAPALPTSASRRPQPVSSSVPSDAPGTNDLLVVMTQRLRTLESQAVMMQKELREKSMKVIEWEDKYKAERIARKDLEQELESLDARVVEQEQQIKEMTAFLADYGLSWVGGSATSSPSTTPRSKPFDLFNGDFNSNATTNTSTPPSALPSTLDSTARPPAVAHATKKQDSKLPFDLNTLTKNAQILSDHVGVTGILPGDQPNSMQIKERDTVYICVYKDGISVNSGLFRPYGWPLCDAVIDDLIEGFYPYEFRDKYPDGFPIKIVNKSEEACPTAPQPSSSGIRCINDMHDHGYKPLTKESLLKKLPERYITSNGHIVEVRNTMAVILSGGTAATQQEQALITTEARHDTSGGNVTALQIKLPQGQKVALHMYFHDTIANVRKELERAAPFFRPANGYELTTAFPRKTYDEHEQTLESLGLVPNGAMMMIKLL